MARSRLTETQMRDVDVLTEAEHVLVDHTTVSGTPLANWVMVTSDHTVIEGENVFIDTTSSGYTITLYSAPVIGNTVSFIDAGENCGTTPATISGGGEKIMGLDENMNIDVDGISFDLVYSNTTFGWRVK